jgi:very-short-patch-repair endonuclease
VVMYRDGEQREFARKMRNEPTEPEHRLWLALRANQLGVKFRRQAAIGSSVVDFVCFSHKLVVELDGVQHAEGVAPEYDARRTSWLESRGFRTLRFWNHELDDGLTLVIAAIQAAVEEATPTTAPSPHPSPPRRGVGAGGTSTGPERGP